MLLRLLRQLVKPADTPPIAATSDQGLDRCRRLEQSGDLEAALECYRAYAAAHPSDMESRVAIANTLTSLWRVEEAIAACAQALAAAPANTELFSSLLLYSHYSAHIAPRELFEAHVRYGELLTRAVAPSYRGTWRVARDPERRLRVGYVSRNFSRHSVGYFVEPVLEHHDPAHFESYCYYTHALSDDVTSRIAAAATVWRHLPDVDADVLAAYVEEDEIDVLVDLAGHTKFTRLGAFAREPAPIQITWLGYPDTTGVPSIGYRITDGIADPPGASDALHTETLVRLASPFLCYRPPPDAPPVAERVTSEGVVFGSFNTVAKLTEPMVEVWSRILLAVPGSRVLLKAALLQNDRARDRVLAHFARAGVAADRVELRGWSSGRDTHLSAYADVDIALDTFPYNGTTTTCEALWMGVPVVTLAGDVHMARVGATLLASVGLDALVAQTPNAYVDAAVNLAHDRERLAEMRRDMRRRLLASPLLDHAGYTRRLEAAYRELWRAWCSRTAERAPA